MMAVFALLSSLLWGTADFLGGSVSRRRPALAVVGGSQAVGGVALLAAAAITGQWRAPADYLPWAVAAGLTGAAALVAFYASLAIGPMGIVSPIAASGVIVPVAYGLIQGEKPSTIQLAGIIVAVLGVLLASGPELTGRATLRPVLLALVAAVGFGVTLLMLTGGGRISPIMTVATMRVTSMVVFVAIALGISTVGGLRPMDLPILGLIGLSDAGANLLFSQASRGGLVAIVAVLGSLYPAATVILARAVDGERLRRVQNVGVVASLVGIALIGAGGS
jgi:drug/metabolite transporter (DMT)-like permease